MRWPWEKEFWSGGSGAEDTVSYTMPIMGGLFGLGGDSAEDLSKQQQERFLQMQQDYLNQIEPNRMARMQALGRTMSLFQPAADVLKEQYGMDFDFGSLLQSDPMTDAETELNARRMRQEGIDAAGRNIMRTEIRRNKEGDPVNWSGLGEGLKELKGRQ